MLSSVYLITIVLFAFISEMELHRKEMLTRLSILLQHWFCVFFHSNFESLGLPDYFLLP